MDFSIFKNINTVYITGHRNPDADSIVSAKLMQDILRYNGIDAQWVFFKGDRVDVSSRMLLEDCLCDKPLVIEETDIADKKFLLVDHNDVMQSVGDISFAVAAIDHHSHSGQLENVYLSKYCCTALFIYEMFKDSYPFSEEEKILVFRAFLSDSVFGKSSRYKASDGEAVKAMGFSNDYTEYFKKYFVPTDLSDPIKAFGENGVKSYKFPWGSFDGGYIEALNSDDLDGYRRFVCENSRNFLGIYIDYSIPESYVYFNFNGKIYEYSYPFIASRAATILPQLVEEFGNK